MPLNGSPLPFCRLVKLKINQAVTALKDHPLSSLDLLDLCVGDRCTGL